MEQAAPSREKGQTAATRLPSSPFDVVTRTATGYGFKTKVADLHEQQVMRWIVEQRQASWTWERIYLELAKRKERTRAGREWSVSRIRRAYAAEIAGKTQEPIPRRPRKRRPKPNLAAQWLHRLVRALR
jgi:hypothetical protein